MDEIVIQKTDRENLRARRIVCYIAGVLEVLLACRFVLKLLGANTKSIFVSIVYSVSQIFLYPFSGIFRSAVTKGIETKSVLEPGTIIAVIVYALVAWGIVKLIEISRTSRKTIIRHKNNRVI
jgi:hypothetical protein